MTSEYVYKMCCFILQHFSANFNCGICTGSSYSYIRTCSLVALQRTLSTVVPCIYYTSLTINGCYKLLKSSYNRHFCIFGSRKSGDMSREMMLIQSSMKILNLIPKLLRTNRRNTAWASQLLQHFAENLL
jgi:hypothetical protein